MTSQTAFTKFNLQIFGEEKTETATPKRRGKAREEGQVCQSRDLNSVVEMLVGLLLISSYGAFVIRHFIVWMQNVFIYIGGTNMGGGDWLDWLFKSGAAMYFMCWLPIGFFSLLAVLIVIIKQIGWKFTTKPFKLNLDRLNPITGMKKLISLRSLVELVKSVFKAAIFGFVLYVAIADKLPLVIGALRYPFEAGVELLSDELWWLSIRMVLWLGLIAAADYMYQKWDFEKKLKMSKHEVKEEHKQMEGDPQIKSKIRQRQREMARKRMMSSVPKSDVVITNPTTLAVALQYDRKTMRAPVVVAKGKGLIAKRIREIAEENDVPILERRPLAWALYESVEIGDEVPETLYKTVAEVLAFVYRLKHKDDALEPRKKPAPHPTDMHPMGMHPTGINPSGINSAGMRR